MLGSSSGLSSQQGGPQEANWSLAFTTLSVEVDEHISLCGSSSGLTYEDRAGQRPGERCWCELSLSCGLSRKLV